MHNASARTVDAFDVVDERGTGRRSASGLAEQPKKTSGKESALVEFESVYARLYVIQALRAGTRGPRSAADKSNLSSHAVARAALHQWHTK